MTDKTLLPPAHGWQALGAVTLALSLLAGCAPLIVGGAMVGGAMVAVDRRTAGAQFEDQAIELKAANRIGELRPNAHVNVTSYNRMVLLTGEVGAEADRAALKAAVEAIENVRSVVDETAVMGNSSLTARTNDTVLSGKVKATLLDAGDLKSSAIKVVTERGTVYLMGRVVEREASQAAQLASRVGGVQKVVRVFELLTEAELAAISPPPAKK